MEAAKAGSILIVLGILSGVVGLFSNNLFWSNLLYIGISWFFAGFAYLLADKEVSDGGFALAFLLGILGAIIWLVTDTSRSGKSYESSHRYVGRQEYYKMKAGENYKCRSCTWFGKLGCGRHETLLNAEPCTDFVLWER